MSIEICPKCSLEFVCNVQEIANCACSKVGLEPRVLNEITKDYDRCLCPTCLQEIAKKYAIDLQN